MDQLLEKIMKNTENNEIEIENSLGLDEKSEQSIAGLDEKNIEELKNCIEDLHSSLYREFTGIIQNLPKKEQLAAEVDEPFLENESDNLDKQIELLILSRTIDLIPVCLLNQSAIDRISMIRKKLDDKNLEIWP